MYRLLELIEECSTDVASFQDAIAVVKSSVGSGADGSGVDFRSPHADGRRIGDGDSAQGAPLATVYSPPDTPVKAAGGDDYDGSSQHHLLASSTGVSAAPRGALDRPIAAPASALDRPAMLPTAASSLPLPAAPSGAAANDPLPSSTTPLPVSYSPLELAIERCHEAAVGCLLAAGAAPDYICGLACTALCRCCYAFPTQLKTMEMLLEAGANPDATTNNDAASASCLIISVMKSNVAAVEVLLRYGANVAYEWKGHNALSMAMDFKKLDIVEVFEKFEFRKAQENRKRRFEAQRARHQTTTTTTESVALTNATCDPAASDGSSLPPTSPPPLTTAGVDLGVAIATGAAPPRALRPSAATASSFAPLAGNAAVPTGGGGGGGGAAARPSATFAVTESELTDRFLDLTTDMAHMDWLLRPDDVSIVTPISAGLHGEVFRGVMNNTGDPVAVKKFPCIDEKARRSFLVEATMMSKFRHENIVLFIGAIIEPSLTAIVSELCVENLYDRLDRPGPLPWSQRLTWARDIARAMTYLHTRTPPVVHRDLKSSNVLIDCRGTAKLCDFGIARLRPHTFVATEHISGSPAWMAPEVLRGDDFDHRGDVYAFGVILWELMTRQAPWPGKNLAQLVGLVGFKDLRLEIPSQPPEGCPPGYLLMMQKCFDVPDVRPTFRTMREQLDAFLSDVD